MLTRSLTFRIAGPTLLVSLLFLGSCITAAFYLHHRQSALLRALDENLWSRRLAADLLRALESLPGDRPAAEDALHGRIGELIGQAERFADKPEEARLVGRLKDGFDRYLRGRRTGAAPAAASGGGRPTGPGHPGGGARPDLSRAGAVQQRGGRPLRGCPAAGGHLDGLGVGRSGCRSGRSPAC